MDHGPQMTQTQNGDGVLLTDEIDIFKLDCTNTTSCLWKKQPNNLQIYRNHHLMFTVPSKFLENCNNTVGMFTKSPVTNIHFGSVLGSDTSSYWNRFKILSSKIESFVRVILGRDSKKKKKRCISVQWCQ